MAKSARASTRKANNRRLKAKVFGPVEAARVERLSAKLLELAAQPKPPKPESDEMKLVDEDDEVKMDEDVPAGPDQDIAMDSDSVKPVPSKRSTRKRIEKRRKVSKIVFPKYKDKLVKKRTS